jgi:UDP-2,3-diacylglucosamine pyrophosphatase LpxH
VVDAYILSDIHLGSDNCQATELVAFLQSIHRGERPTRTLILNGDLFDSFDFRRLKKRHWKILSLVRKMSDVVDVVWINGNHDGPAEIVSHLLGVDVRDEYVLESGGERILILHGHRFDNFIETYPWTTWVADRLYRLLQKLDRNHHVARMAKRSSKLFLRCVKQIEEQSTRYARELGCAAVCCGHTHVAIESITDSVRYFNSGCWTERPCHFLSVDAGRVSVEQFVHDELTVYAGDELAVA